MAASLSGTLHSHPITQVRMRYDKPWHSCWTMRNLEELQTK